MHLVDNLAEVLLELRRVLKPGGTLHATVDSFEYIQDFSQKAAYQRKHHIVEYFSETTSSNRLHEAGFIVETSQSILGGKPQRHTLRNTLKTGALFRVFWPGFIF